MIGLVVHVVYKNPSDYPGKFVVRQWRNSPDGGQEYVEQPSGIFDTFEECFAVIPNWAVETSPTSQDDPAIYRVFI